MTVAPTCAQRERLSTVGAIGPAPPKLLGRRRRLLAAAALAAAAVVVAVAASEVAHARAARRPESLRPCRGSCAVVVLGYTNASGGELHPLQRWRTEIAVRTFHRSEDGVLIFTGGPSKGGKTEAEVMAAYAIERLGVDRARVRLEERATSTFENVKFSLPMTTDFDAVAFASDPIHAARARAYATQQQPDVAPKLAAADDYRILERWWLKVPTAADGARRWVLSKL